MQSHDSHEYEGTSTTGTQLRYTYKRFRVARP